MLYLTAINNGMIYLTAVNNSMLYLAISNSNLAKKTAILTKVPNILPGDHDICPPPGVYIKAVEYIPELESEVQIRSQEELRIMTNL